MVYQVKYNKNQRHKGVTLMEVLIVIAIFSILTSAIFLGYINFTSRNNLQIATLSLVEALRFAQTNAQATTDDSKWGVLATSSQIIIFKGSSYINRNPSFDQTLNWPREIAPSGLIEIIFEKMTGETFNIGTTTLTNNNSEIKNVYINTKGVINY